MEQNIFPTFYNLHNDQKEIDHINPPFNQSEESQGPCVRIVEQPCKYYKFRYESENRFSNFVHGENYTIDTPTYPSIEVINYKGPILVIVSCVTKSPPHRQHPYKIRGQDINDFKCGVFVKQYDTTDDTIISFNQLAIQRVTNKNIKKSLEERKIKGIDPFGCGFHLEQYEESNIKRERKRASALRLAIQVFVPKNGNNFKFTKETSISLNVSLSNVINDKDNELLITRTSEQSSPINGNKIIVLYSENAIEENDIHVKFFSCDNKWVGEGKKEFIHKQLAIQIQTPPYNIHNPIKTSVYLCLYRPSDKAVSSFYPFEYESEFQRPDSKELLKRLEVERAWQEIDEASKLLSFDLKTETDSQFPPEFDQHNAFNNVFTNLGLLGPSTSNILNKESNVAAETSSKAFILTESEQAHNIDSEIMTQNKKGMNGYPTDTTQSQFWNFRNQNTNIVGIHNINDFSKQHSDNFPMPVDSELSGEIHTKRSKPNIALSYLERTQFNLNNVLEDTLNAASNDMIMNFITEKELCETDMDLVVTNLPESSSSTFGMVTPGTEVVNPFTQLNGVQNNSSELLNEHIDFTLEMEDSIKCNNNENVNHIYNHNITSSKMFLS